MKLLTQAAAAAELETGDRYRLGYNRFNAGELIVTHGAIESPTDANPFTGEILTGHTQFGEGQYAYEFAGVYCSGSGAEQLWILESGETCEDIPTA